MKLLSFETFRLSLNNFRVHKLRSLLTSLGIIFGVAVVAQPDVKVEPASDNLAEFDGGWVECTGLRERTSLVGRLGR